MMENQKVKILASPYIRTTQTAGCIANGIFDTECSVLVTNNLANKCKSKNDLRKGYLATQKPDKNLNNFFKNKIRSYNKNIMGETNLIYPESVETKEHFRMRVS